MAYNQLVMDICDTLEHHIDDNSYMNMVEVDSLEGVDKTVLSGQVFEIDNILSNSDDMLVVCGDNSPSIAIKLNKEREFLRSNSLTKEELIESILNGQKYCVKITSTENGLVGSFNEAKMESIYSEFFQQVKHPTKVYEAKILRKNRGGYFVIINGAEAFLPGSLASANKIMNFDALIGKTLKVMVDSYISENNTFIVSNKKYIETIIPTMIETIDISQHYEGVVTGAIQNGIFVEFNEVMTGLISLGDMSKETEKRFNSGNIRAGDRIGIYVRDIIPPKNFVLTQIPDKIHKIQDELKVWQNTLQENPEPLQMRAVVETIKGPYITVNAGGVSTTLYAGPQLTNDIRTFQISEVILSIRSVDAKRNKIEAEISKINE